ncbi:MAG: response regulator [Xanthobacteraceae bacterium]
MPHILVIDDDKLVREATQILLRARGYEVSVAADGKSGIAAAEAGRFDVVIVDLFMPEMDGLSVMRAIRRAKPTMPMIAASGFMLGGRCESMPGFEDMVSEAGAACALYKPFKPDEIFQAIEKAMTTAAAT